MLKKQNFPVNFLKRHAGSSRSFDLGHDLFKNQRIESGPVGNSKNNMVRYTVRDRREEKVSLQFYKNGVNRSYTCSCEFSNRSDGLCPHVIAALLDLNQYESEEIPLEDQTSNFTVHHSANSLAISKLLDDYKKKDQARRHQLDQQVLNIEYSLRISGYGRATYYLLTIKAGADYLYVVKDIEEFLDKISHQEPLVFGKNFTYQPDQHRIDRQDQKMLGLLSRIIQVSYTGNRTYDKRELLIPPEFMQAVLKQLKEVDAGFLYNQFLEKEGEATKSLSQSIYIQENARSLPLQFRVVKKDNYHALQAIDVNWERLFFFPRADMVYYQDTYYFFNHEDYSNLSALIDSFSSVSYQPLVFDTFNFTSFASQVLPRINQLISIELTEQVQEDLILPPLQAQIYIDYQADRLMVRPVFKYLSQSFYPYEEGEEDSTSSSQDRIVVRNLQQEADRLDRLDEALKHFNRQDHYLESDELVYISDFLYQSLPELSDYFEILMTQSGQDLIYQPQQSPLIHMDVSGSSQLLEFSFEMEDIPEEDLSDVINMLARDRRYYRLSNGKVLNLKDQTFQEMGQAVQRLGLESEEIQQKMHLPLFKGLNFEDHSWLDKGRDLQTIEGQLQRPEDLDFDLPTDLEADLRSYQVKGYKWLRILDYYGFGAVLADDMGLGKTVQTIALILSKIEQEPDQQFLVVCPASVLHNWQYEFSKFAPEAKTQLIYGNKKEREDRLVQAKEEKSQVLITSYPLIQRDIDLYQDFNFTNLVLDEAQYVKNMNTKTTQSVRKIPRQQVVALSGTPIENHLGELYSLFSIVMPGLFTSPSTFKRMSHKNIAHKVEPFILRRMKKDVLTDLPDKTESIEYIDLSKDQKVLYQTQLALLKKDIQGYEAEGSLSQNSMNILAGMTRLRQICNDPQLIQSSYQGESSKLNRLMELLDEARENGRRVVLFSQFTQMLVIIRRAVEERGYDYHYLDGTTPADKRLDLANQFNLGEKNLFLISLRAGGTGLNLTGGDTVVLYDSWWNPAVEDQAADRVHRFGQKKAVQVIRLISKGTIEERIHDLQEEKRDLVDSVIETGDQDRLRLTSKELVRIIEESDYSYEED